MSIKNYVGRGLATLALAGSLFFSGCSDYQLPKPQRLEQRISQEVAQPNGKPDKFAVIISGNTDYRHKENLSLAYLVLLENGFQRENVYILDKKGDKIVRDIYNSIFYPVDDIASKEAIQMLFGHLAKKVDSEDLLFVYTTAHGGRTTINEKVNDKSKRVKISDLSLPGGDLLETEMARYLSEIHPKTGVLVFDQCYGGGFAERTGRGNYIGISASEADKKSCSNTFPQAFFNSWIDSQSDANRDRQLSVKEAFDYAVENDEETKSGFQKPQIFSEINTDEVFLK